MNNEQQISPEDFDRIERYLLEQMSEGERVAFDQQIAIDAALRQELATMSELYKGINEAALVDRMDAYHESLKTNKTPSRKIKLPVRKWLAAAILIVALGIGWLFSHKNKNEQLYAQYYRPDPGLITAMGSSDNYAFDHAMVDYKTGNYDASIKAWEQQLIAKPDNDTLNYFIGCAWLGKHEEQKSIGFLQKVANTSGSYFQRDAKWYLGLALLKEGKQKEAIELISQSQHNDKERLLMQLNKQ